MRMGKAGVTGKAVSTVSAIALAAGLCPVGAWAEESPEAWSQSTESLVAQAIMGAQDDGQTLDPTHLSDGVYEVSVSLNSAADVDSPTMPSVFLEEKARLYVIDGKIYIVATLKEASIMGANYSADGILFYPEGSFSVNNGVLVTTDGVKPSSTVLTYRRDSSDKFNHYAENVMASLPASAATNGGYMAVAMGSSVMSSNALVLKADWSKLVQTSTEKPQMPKPDPADKEALKSELARAKSVEQGDGSADGYQALQQQIEQAQAVYDNAGATQQSVDTVAKDLHNMALAYPRTQLQELYDKARAVDRNKYTSASYAKLVEQINAAKAVLDDEESSIAQIDAAYDALKAAYDGLEEQHVDKSKLAAKIESANAIEQGKKTASDFKQLKDAIAAAQKVYSNGDATQSDVNDALAELSRAVKKFEKAADAPDADELGDLIDEARAIEQGAKTDEAFMALQDAIAQARSVYGDDKATQKQIDAAVDSLEEAIDEFEASEDRPADEPGEEPGDKPGDKPSDQPGGESGDDSGDKPSDQPGDKPTDQPGGGASDKPSDQPGSEAGDGSGEDPSDRPGAQQGDKPADKPSDQPVGGSDDKPADQPSGQSDDGLAADLPEGVVRLAGQDGLATMEAIVNASDFPKGGVAVVATFDGYWDALTAAGIAGMADAPVLMTMPDALSSETARLLKSLAPTTVVVCGGEAAVPESVAKQVSEAAGGAKIVRAAGADAIGTALDIYDKAVEVSDKQWSNTAFLCTNDGYWDALAAAPVSYAKHMPIFLTEGSSEVTDEMPLKMIGAGIEKVYIVGGEKAVSTSVEAKLSASGIAVGQRLGGATAIETSEAVAEFGISLGMSANGLGVATTNGYWDALSGAALCGRLGSVLVLADGPECHSIAGFANEHGADIEGAYVFGGPAAVSEETLSALELATY